MKSEIEKFVNMVYGDTKGLYNLTVTFNPKKYSCLQSWSNEILLEVVNEIQQYSKHFYLVKEKMNNNHFCHFHGQVYIPKDKQNVLLARLNKKFGKTTLPPNMLRSEYSALMNRLGVKNNSEYETYHEYCMKEFEEHKKWGPGHIYGIYYSKEKNQNVYKEFKTEN